MTWQENYQIWADRTDLPAYLAESLALLTDDKQKEDAFYTPLSFGTAASYANSCEK